MSDLQVSEADEHSSNSCRSPAKHPYASLITGPYHSALPYSSGSPLHTLDYNKHRQPILTASVSCSQ